MRKTVSLISGIVGKELRLLVCFWMFCLMMFWCSMFMSRYPETFLTFAITLTIILFDLPQIVSYSTSSSLSLSFLLPHQRVVRYHLHSPNFSYAISYPFHLYPLQVFFTFKKLKSILHLKSFENHSSSYFEDNLNNFWKEIMVYTLYAEFFFVYSISEIFEEKNSLPYLHLDISN